MNLTDKQRLALKNANTKAKIHQKNIAHLVIDKFISNNIDVKYIDKIKVFIETNVSMTTKIKCNILSNFILDPILKNKIELTPTDISYIDYRKKKEDVLFNKAYSEAEASERVKYGSLNLKNLISGDPLASMYGDTTIFYKNDIKDRVTFIYGNSEASMMYICTFKYFEHILFHCPIEDIKLLVSLIDSQSNNKNFKSYIEIQLHGVVDLTKDVEKITMDNKTYNLNKELVDKFIKTYPSIDVLIY